MWYVIKEDELYHHGIKGQKWGVRRFQNPDGTLTSAGERRYAKALRFRSSMDRRIERSELADAKIMNTRKVNREKLGLKYDRKIAKAGESSQKAAKLKDKKNAQIQDFDNGTKAVRLGFKKYNDIMRDYRDTKADSIMTGEKSEKYKQAAKAYTRQHLNDVVYGSSVMTKVSYASDYARELGYGG